MSQWNIAAKPKDDQDKVNVDLAASGVAYKERLNMPVVPRWSPESSLSTSESISWSEFSTTASRASSYPEHQIRATSRWPSRTPKSSFDFPLSTSHNHVIGA